MGRENSNVTLELTRNVKTGLWSAEWFRKNLDRYDVDLMERRLEWMEEERQKEEGKTELERVAERVPGLVQEHYFKWQARKKRDWGKV